jgi:diguanylate cyclase (GGDEF)-like protein
VDKTILKTYLPAFLTVALSICLFLLTDYIWFVQVDTIKYSYLILEFTLSMFALVPFFAIQKYKERRFYWCLNFGFYLLFASYFVDALDQIFLHTKVYTVILEKITLIVAAIFIFYGSKQWMKSYEEIALTDDLTEVANRRLIRQLISHEMKMCSGNDSTFSLAIIDIDFFKNINDKHGHHMGDKALKLFAQLIKASLVSESKMGRWGGEEFLVMLKGQDIHQAKKNMEILREKIAKHNFVIDDQEIKMTASIGISQLHNNDKDFESLFIRADKLMFQAKESGRNQFKSQ